MLAPPLAVVREPPKLMDTPVATLCPCGSGLRAVRCCSMQLQSPPPESIRHLVPLVERAGHVAWTGPLELAVAERKVVEVPELAVNTGPGTTLARPTKPETSAPAEASHSNALGWVVLGTGVVALGVGTYFGVSALSTQNKVNQECPTLQSCSPKGIDLSHDAQAERGRVTSASASGSWVSWSVATSLLSAPSSAKASNARVAPGPLRVSATRHGGELSLRGSGEAPPRVGKCRRAGCVSAGCRN